MDSLLNCLSAIRVISLYRSTRPYVAVTPKQIGQAARPSGITLGAVSKVS